jgi:hypothetical protein
MDLMEPQALDLNEDENVIVIHVQLTNGDH